MGGVDAQSAGIVIDSAEFFYADRRAGACSKEVMKRCISMA
jgi:hypothetical protein